MFMRRKPFTAINVSTVPKEAGVYIIYDRASREAVYVGRSRVSIYDRLNKHVTGLGSRKIAEVIRRRVELDFEYQVLGSPEQAEAQLIQALGTTRLFNLRRETDPADWE